jgi:hypothetical protein
MRPETETRGDRVRQLLVGLGVIIVLASLVAIIILSVVLIRSGDNHHSATVKENQRVEQLLGDVKSAISDHSATLADIKALDQNVAKVIDSLPASDATLTQFAAQIDGELAALCNSAHVTCAS